MGGSGPDFDDDVEAAIRDLWDKTAAARAATDLGMEDAVVDDDEAMEELIDLLENHPEVVEAVLAEAEGTDRVDKANKRLYDQGMEWRRSVAAKVSKVARSAFEKSASDVKPVAKINASSLRTIRRLEEDGMWPDFVERMSLHSAVMHERRARTAAWREMHERLADVHSHKPQITKHASHAQRGGDAVTRLYQTQAEKAQKNGRLYPFGDPATSWSYQELYAYSRDNPDKLELVRKCIPGGFLSPASRELSEKRVQKSGVSHWDRLTAQPSIQPTALFGHDESALNTSAGNGTKASTSATTAKKARPSGHKSSAELWERLATPIQPPQPPSVGSGIPIINRTTSSTGNVRLAGRVAQPVHERLYKDHAAGKKYRQELQEVADEGRANVYREAQARLRNRSLPPNIAAVVSPMAASRDDQNDVYARGREWERRRQEKTDDIRDALASKELDGHTFSPSINPASAHRRSLSPPRPGSPNFETGERFTMGGAPGSFAKKKMLSDGTSGSRASLQQPRPAATGAARSAPGSRVTSPRAGGKKWAHGGGGPHRASSSPTLIGRRNTSDPTAAPGRDPGAAAARAQRSESSYLPRIASGVGAADGAGVAQTAAGTTEHGTITSLRDTTPPPGQQNIATDGAASVVSVPGAAADDDLFAELGRTYVTVVSESDAAGGLSVQVTRSASPGAQSRGSEQLPHSTPMQGHHQRTRSAGASSHHAAASDQVMAHVPQRGGSVGGRSTGGGGGTNANASANILSSYLESKVGADADAVLPPPRPPQQQLVPMDADGGAGGGGKVPGTHDASAADLLHAQQQQQRPLTRNRSYAGGGGGGGGAAALSLTRAQSARHAGTGGAAGGWPEAPPPQQQQMPQPLPHDPDSVASTPHASHAGIELSSAGVNNMRSVNTAVHSYPSGPLSVVSHAPGGADTAASLANPRSAQSVAAFTAGAPASVVSEAVSLPLQPFSAPAAGEQKQQYPTAPEAQGGLRRTPSSASGAVTAAPTQTPAAPVQLVANETSLVHHGEGAAPPHRPHLEEHGAMLVREPAPRPALYEAVHYQQQLAGDGMVYPPPAQPLQPQPQQQQHQQQQPVVLMEHERTSTMCAAAPPPPPLTGAAVTNETPQHHQTAAAAPPPPRTPVQLVASGNTFVQMAAVAGPAAAEAPTTAPALTERECFFLKRLTAKFEGLGIVGDGSGGDIAAAVAGVVEAPPPQVVAAAGQQQPQPPAAQSGEGAAEHRGGNEAGPALVHAHIEHTQAAAQPQQPRQAEARVGAGNAGGDGGDGSSLSLVQSLSPSEMRSLTLTQGTLPTDGEAAQGGPQQQHQHQPQPQPQPQFPTPNRENSMESMAVSVDDAAALPFFEFNDLAGGVDAVLAKTLLETGRIVQFDKEKVGKAKAAASTILSSLQEQQHHQPSTSTNPNTASPAASPERFTADYLEAVSPGMHAGGPASSAAAAAATPAARSPILLVDSVVAAPRAPLSVSAGGSTAAPPSRASVRTPQVTAAGTSMLISSTDAGASYPYGLTGGSAVGAAAARMASPSFGADEIPVPQAHVTQPQAHAHGAPHTPPRGPVVDAALVGVGEAGGHYHYASASYPPQEAVATPPRQQQQYDDGSTRGATGPAPYDTPGLQVEEVVSATQPNRSPHVGGGERERLHRVQAAQQRQYEEEDEDVHGGASTGGDGHAGAFLGGYRRADGAVPHALQTSHPEYRLTATARSPTPRERYQAAVAGAVAAAAERVKPRPTTLDLTAAMYAPGHVGMAAGQGGHATRPSRNAPRSPPEVPPSPPSSCGHAWEGARGGGYHGGQARDTHASTASAAPGAELPSTPMHRHHPGASAQRSQKGTQSGRRSTNTTATTAAGGGGGGGKSSARSGSAKRNAVLTPAPAPTPSTVRTASPRGGSAAAARPTPRTRQQQQQKKPSRPAQLPTSPPARADEYLPSPVVGSKRQHQHQDIPQAPHYTSPHEASRQSQSQGPSQHGGRGSVGGGGGLSRPPHRTSRGPQRVRESSPPAHPPGSSPLRRRRDDSPLDEYYVGSDGVVRLLKMGLQGGRAAPGGGGGGRLATQPRIDYSRGGEGMVAWEASAGAQLPPLTSLDDRQTTSPHHGRRGGDAEAHAHAAAGGSNDGGGGVAVSHSAVVQSILDAGLLPTDALQPWQLSQTSGGGGASPLRPGRQIRAGGGAVDYTQGDAPHHHALARKQHQQQHALRRQMAASVPTTRPRFEHLEESEAEGGGGGDRTMDSSEGVGGDGAPSPDYESGTDEVRRALKALGSKPINTVQGRVPGKPMRAVPPTTTAVPSPAAGAGGEPSTPPARGGFRTDRRKASPDHAQRRVGKDSVALGEEYTAATDTDCVSVSHDTPMMTAAGPPGGDGFDPITAFHLTPDRELAVKSTSAATRSLNAYVRATAAASPDTQRTSHPMTLSPARTRAPLQQNEWDASTAPALAAAPQASLIALLEQDRDRAAASPGGYHIAAGAPMVVRSGSPPRP